MRKAAIRLAGATQSDPLKYMQMPARDFVELYNEVVEEWRATEH